MTSGALFRREWKRSTYKANKICLEYLSHAIYIQKQRQRNFRELCASEIVMEDLRSEIDERQVEAEMNLHKDSLEIYVKDCCIQ